jgi:hypothetical protein
MLISQRIPPRCVGGSSSPEDDACLIAEGAKSGRSAAVFTQRVEDNTFHQPESWKPSTFGIFGLPDEFRNRVKVLGVFCFGEQETPNIQRPTSNGEQSKADLAFIAAER